MVIVKVLINLCGVLALELLELAEPLLDVQEHTVVCVRSVDADGGDQDAMGEIRLGQDCGHAHEHFVKVPRLVHVGPMVSL